MNNDFEQRSSRLPYWLKGFFIGIVSAFGIAFLYLLPILPSLFFGKGMGRIDSWQSYFSTLLEIFIFLSVIAGIIGILYGLIKENAEKKEKALQNNTELADNVLSSNHKTHRSSSSSKKGPFISLLFSLPICYWFVTLPGVEGSPAILFVPILIIVLLGLYGKVIESAWGNKKAIIKAIIVPLALVAIYSLFLFVVSLWNY